MAIVHWQPFSEMESVRRQMDRLFDELTNGALSQPVAFKPAIELKDTETDLILKAQIPGMNADDLDVSVTRDSVTIQGERKYEQTSESEGVYRSEFRYGQFHRAIELPAPIEQEKVTADYTDGVLTLTLPKVQDKTRQAVKVNLKPSVESRNDAQS